jgi:hypothetical protein
MNVISSENLLEYAGANYQLTTKVASIINPLIFVLDIPELLTALPTTIATIPPTAIALKQLISMLPQMEDISLTVISAIIEILQRWNSSHRHELQESLIESVEELISSIQAEEDEEIQRVGKHWVTTFELWWKMRSSHSKV